MTKRIAMIGAPPHQRQTQPLYDRHFLGKDNLVLAAIALVSVAFAIGLYKQAGVNVILSATLGAFGFFILFSLHYLIIQMSSSEALMPRLNALERVVNNIARDMGQFDEFSREMAGFRNTCERIERLHSQLELGGYGEALQAKDDLSLLLGQEIARLEGQMQKMHGEFAHVNQQNKLKLKSELGVIEKLVKQMGTNTASQNAQVLNLSGQIDNMQDAHFLDASQTEHQDLKKPNLPQRLMPQAKQDEIPFYKRPPIKERQRALAAKQGASPIVTPHAKVIPGKSQASGQDGVQAGLFLPHDNSHQQNYVQNQFGSAKSEVSLRSAGQENSTTYNTQSNFDGRPLLQLNLPQTLPESFPDNLQDNLSTNLAETLPETMPGTLVTSHASRAPDLSLKNLSFTDPKVQNLAEQTPLAFSGNVEQPERQNLLPQSEMQELPLPTPAPAQAGLHETPYDMYDNSFGTYGTNGSLDQNMLSIIHHAIEANKIDLFLQPIVKLPDRNVVYYEALTRLRGATDELILPVNYISIAEQAGLMPIIDNVMLYRSVQVMRRLAQHGSARGLFCNIAHHSLLDAQFYSEFIEFMSQNNILTNSLFFDFNQEMLKNSSSIEHESVAALSRLGYKFCLDKVTNLDIDFANLQNLGFAYIRISADILLRGMEKAKARIHAADMQSYLNRFGIQLIVEKVEDERSLSQLSTYGIKLAQGYLFSEPRPVRPEVLAEH